MSDNKQTTPPQLSPELIQMLAAMQAKAAQQQGGNPTNSVQAPKPFHIRRQEVIMKTAQWIGLKLQNGVKNIDRFINFTVKPNDPHRNDVVQTARTPILFGAYIIIGFFVFGGLWAALAPLDSAAVAIGTVISSSKLQKLQFLQHGNISAIYVKEGDHVKAGDPLVALEKTRFQAEYSTLLNQYRTHIASEARLVAERDEAKDITFPEELLKNADDPEIAKILHTQQHLFQYQRDTIASTIEQLRKRLDGLESRKKAAEKGYQMMVDRVKAARELLSKGFMHKAGLLDLETKEISYKSEVADTESKIAETSINLNSVKSDSMTKVLRELKDTQINLADTYERLSSAKDALDHSTLTSPVDGIVNHIHVSTIGGVVGGGNPIVEISPENDALVIEARVSPRNIDSVQVGLNAKIRFSAFKSRTTPVFNGKVVALSHDVVSDPSAPSTGQEPTYYAARIEVDMDEFNEVAKKRDIKLQPGMQAEVQIITGERTLLRYLLDPVTDSMFKALKEK